MTQSKRIRSVNVLGLQEMFDYKLEFPDNSDTIVVIAPNGYGKTAFLSLINSCLRFDLLDAGEHSFKQLDVTFQDRSRWSFTKIPSSPEKPVDWTIERRLPMHRRSSRRRLPIVEVRFFDEKGKAQKNKDLEDIRSIPFEILSRAVDISLPVHRESIDTFRDLRRGDLVKLSQIIDRYGSELTKDSNFKDYVATFEPGLFQQLNNSRFSCVFIETQRLLFTRKSRAASDASKEPEEEIIRQAGHLASFLQATYANYASTSQSLDRSFPNRLIAKSEGTGPREFLSLRSDLNAIEARRRALTEAGILVEDAEHVVAPKDELLPSVADALAIYVEDSKTKLATFDEIYPKVSVFRELLSKKLAPKELIISRGEGAEVRRDKHIVPLDRLSSGEKHEFTMLFRLIFETPSNSLVLIDEPEISLHVAWQLEFMSDLQRIRSANSFQSIIATHSPQIIQGVAKFVIDLAKQAP